MMLKVFVRIFGNPPRINGLSEQLKKTQKRLDEAELKADNAFQQMQRWRLDFNSESQHEIVSLIPKDR